MRIVLAVILAKLLICAGAACAQNPEELVRSIYGDGGAKSSIDRLRAPTNRARYFQPALVRLLNANDANDTGECIDFGLHINGQDYDQAEIARTLKLEERSHGTAASVDARFTSFRKPNHIRYEFVRVGADWKIADIASFGDVEWRLSSIRCSKTGQRLPDRANVVTSTVASNATPSQVASQRPPGRYCFVSPGTTLRMEIGADRSAQFRIDGGGGGRHTCGVEGRAMANSQGWRFERRVNEGACRLDLVQGKRGTITVHDRGGICRTEFCGAAAGLGPAEFTLSRGKGPCFW